MVMMMRVLVADGVMDDEGVLVADGVMDAEGVLVVLVLVLVSLLHQPSMSHHHSR